MSGRLQPDEPEQVVEASGMTYDDALAIALSKSKPGDLIAVHEATCDSCVDGDPYDDERCCCTPMILTIGAKA